MFYLRIAIWLLLLGLFFIFLQGAVLKSLLPGFLVPNLVISLLVFLAFYENSPFGAFLAFLLGLEVDFYSGQMLLVGPAAGAYVAVFGLIASLSQRIFVDSDLAVLVVTFFATVGCTIMYVVLVYEFNGAGLRLIPASLAYGMTTALATPFLFRILRWIFRCKGSSSIGGRARGVTA